MNENNTSELWKIRETSFNDIEIWSPDRLIARVYKYDEYDFEIANANAKLLVAAPKMLDALRMMRSALGNSFTKKNAAAAYYAIDAAIAEATGEQK